MIFESIEVGPLSVNCYIVACEKSREGIVVDPGGDVDLIAALVQQHGLKIHTIINTHGHFDHLGGNRKALEVFGAKLLMDRFSSPEDVASIVIRFMFFRVAWVRLVEHQSIADRPLLLLGVLLAFTGVQFLTFGLLAELMARTYYESQGKPTYVIREIRQAEAEPAAVR